MTIALAASVRNLSFYGSLTLTGTSTGSSSIITPSSFYGNNARAGSRIYYITVDSGAVRWGYFQSSYKYGLELVSFTAGDLIVITNNGVIAGSGGVGGYVSVGGDGYSAINLASLPPGVTVFVTNNGTIAGGGGGGGGGSGNAVAGGGGQGSGASYLYGGASSWNTTGTDGSAFTPGTGGGGGTVLNGTGGAANVGFYPSSRTAYQYGFGGGGGGSAGIYASTGPSDEVTVTGGAGGGPGVAGADGSVAGVIGSPIYSAGGGGGALARAQLRTGGLR